MNKTAFNVTEFSRTLTKLGLQVVMTREHKGWFSVVNRRQIAMFRVVDAQFVCGWCETANGRTDTTDPEKLLLAVRAVIS